MLETFKRFALQQQMFSEGDVPTKARGNLQLCQWLASVGPTSLETSWTADSLVVFGSRELAKAQEGLALGPADLSWQNRIAVGSICNNPISFSLDPGGGIHYSIHGQGDWEFEELAPDLHTLANCLGEWCKLYRSNSGNIFDAQWNIRPEFYENFDQVFSRIVNRSQLAIWRKAMG